MSSRINDPLGFANGVMPRNPPKAYRAVIMRPDGSVSITHEFPRGFLEQVVIQDALAQVPGGRLLEIIRDEDKEAWIRAHTKPRSASKASGPKAKASAKKTAPKPKTKSPAKKPASKPRSKGAVR